jgi:hypothetical protein
MKSPSLKFEEKKIQIAQDTSLLWEKIAYAEKNIPFNNQKLTDNLDEHCEFISFVELMKIYELYKWKKIKFEYKYIKEKTNVDKKIYNQIICILSNIFNYLNEQDANIITNTINKLKLAHETMLYNYALLQQKHREISNKCKYFIKNSEFTKIYEINSQIQPLITKLYVNYIDFKIINKKTRMLSNEKSKILNEMQSINQSISQIH